MHAFNLKQVADFPTRMITNGGTLIDHTFIDSTISGKLKVEPIRYGLSDHNAQIISLKYEYIEMSHTKDKLKIRLINDQTKYHFLALLKEETWNSIYGTHRITFQSSHIQCTEFLYSYLLTQF